MRTSPASRRAQVSRSLVFLNDGWHAELTIDPEVPGHKSTLAFGLLGSGEGVPVVAMLGRVRNLSDVGPTLPF